MILLFYNTPELFNTFGIIRDPLQPFASNSLCPTSSKILSSFFVVLIAEHLKSSAPSHESYIQLPHPFCSTGNNGCKAQQKLFGAFKRNILVPSSFSNV